ncbi:acyl-CoA dehydrogenase [Agrococcus terreus]|uniref:Acyl-CoA dehydrogenase n=1 Tax=Agrococcus terreus TaxID=574649 RepID=A0ABQ2KP44_9MICO|nr:acyl-CoA dehydrogenase [Agrococcus terreus]GGN89100.1 acyl-CoA dehydrogenase [Agrococcus terreus]
MAVPRIAPVDVTIDDGRGARLPDLPADVGAALEAAPAIAAAIPLPASGRTAERLEALAALGAHDLEVARAIEPHLDAVAILAEAGDAPGPGAYGVFAAEGPGVRLELREGRLEGEKPWCSLAGSLDRALVSAWQGEERVLVDVDLRQPGVEPADDAWHARGLAGIPSGPVRFAGAAARAVREPGWYLRRPGFAWGGIGVAACWHGGAVGVARRLATHAGDAPLRLAHLGAVDEALTASRLALADAARRIDAGIVDDPGLLALRTRGIVARAVEEVVSRVGRALGPAPLALEAEHARRVADLQLYVRQHHAERDQASLGALVAAAGGRAW